MSAPWLLDDATLQIVQDYLQRGYDISYGPHTLGVPGYYAWFVLDNETNHGDERSSDWFSTGHGRTVRGAIREMHWMLQHGKHTRWNAATSYRTLADTPPDLPGDVPEPSKPAYKRTRRIMLNAQD